MHYTLTTGFYSVFTQDLRANINLKQSYSKARLRDILHFTLPIINNIIGNIQLSRIPVYKLQK